MIKKLLNTLQGDFTMLSFLKKIFGAKAAETTTAPYKVETAQFPFPKTVEEKKPVSKPKTKSATKKTVAKKTAPKS